MYMYRVINNSTISTNVDVKIWQIALARFDEILR